MHKLALSCRLVFPILTHFCQGLTPMRINLFTRHFSTTRVKAVTAIPLEMELFRDWRCSWVSLLNAAQGKRSKLPAGLGLSNTTRRLLD